MLIGAIKPELRFLGHIKRTVWLIARLKTGWAALVVARRQNSSYPTEQPANGYRAGAARQHLAVDPTSIPLEQLGNLVLLNVPPGAQLSLHFMLVPSCFECTLGLGKGDTIMLLWVANKHLRSPSGLFLEGAWLLLTDPMFGFSRSARRQVWSLTHKQVDKALNAKLVKQS